MERYNSGYSAIPAVLAATAVMYGTVMFHASRHRRREEQQSQQNLEVTREVYRGYEEQLSCLKVEAGLDLDGDGIKDAFPVKDNPRCRIRKIYW